MKRKSRHTLWRDGESDLINRVSKYWRVLDTSSYQSKDPDPSMTGVPLAADHEPKGHASGTQTSRSRITRRRD